MNLSYLSFYSQYFNSPQTIFHKINQILKFILVFSSLILIIYFSSYYIFSVFILLILISQIYLLYYIPFFIITKNLFIYLIYLTLYVKSYNHIININSIYPNIVVPIPLTINFFSHIKIINLQYFIYLIPEFLTRMILIKFIYFIIIQIFFITTKYECITLVILSFLTKISLFTNIYDKNLNIVLSFSFHLLERMIYRLNNTYLSTKIYYKISPFRFSNLTILLMLLITNIINICNDIYDISSILWSRRIILNNFFI